MKSDRGSDALVANNVNRDEGVAPTLIEPGCGKLHGRRVTV
jgi:hypothetical protein